jgi:sulfur carrier protein
MRSRTMTLTVNGKLITIDVKENFTVTGLLGELKVKQAEFLTVELNGEILDRNEFDSTIIQDGNQIEFLYLMGGGR